MAAVVAAAAFATGGACRRPRVVPAAPAPALPDDVAGFAAGPLAVEAGAARRTYTRGNAHVTVTLARFAMTAAQYADWVRNSTDGYPQAPLDVPAGEGNGFYQCTGGARPSCDLLIQLRAGVHLELRGDGSTARADVDDVARGLPLRALAATPGGYRGDPRPAR